MWSRPTSCTRHSASFAGQSAIVANKANSRGDRFPRVPWALTIVVSSPGFHIFLSIRQGQEPVLVQALLPEPHVECLPFMTLGKALSVGLPGRLKSGSTSFRHAHWSRCFEVNSGPLSTQMVLGSRCCSSTRRRLTSATPMP